MTADRIDRPRRGLLGAGLATLLAFALLCSLGLWQLHRLAWKQELLAAIATRTTAPPVPLPPASEWARLRPEDYAYRHVTLTGTFLNGDEALVFRPLPEARGPYHGVGYLVLTPLRLASGGIVIVNRGFVPPDRRDPATRAQGQIEGEVTLTGLMREPESRNLFTPADDPARNQWFTRDPAAIAAFHHLEDVAPFTVDEDAGSMPGGLPQGGETVLVIPNNHLSYALTWFGLAAALLGVFAAYAWGRMRGRAAIAPPDPSA